MTQDTHILVRALRRRTAVVLLMGLIALISLAGCAATAEDSMKQGLYMSRLSAEGLYRAIVQADELHHKYPTQSPAVAPQDMHRATVAFEAWRILQHQTVDAARKGVFSAEQLDMMSAALVHTLVLIAEKYNIVMEPPKGRAPAVPGQS